MVYRDEAYVTQFRGRMVAVSHLVADTEDELHEAARWCGLSRAWFREHPTHPHYDLIGKKKIDAADRQRVLVVPSDALLLAAKNMERWPICDYCHGSGEEDDGMQVCTVCKGRTRRAPEREE